MMHHLALEVGLVDPTMETKTCERENMKWPICPKPRRLRSATPDLLKSLRCGKHCQQNGDGRNATGNLIVDDVGLVIQAGDEDESGPGFRCSPPCDAGSPPMRTDNPLVHDVRFIRQMELLSPFGPAKLSDQFNFPSASPV